MLNRAFDRIGISIVSLLLLSGCHQSDGDGPKGACVFMGQCSNGSTLGECNLVNGKFYEGKSCDGSNLSIVEAHTVSGFNEDLVLQDASSGTLVELRHGMTKNEVELAAAKNGVLVEKPSGDDWRFGSNAIHFTNDVLVSWVLPTLRLAKSHHAFGIIPVCCLVSHTYLATNTGPRPIFINNLIPSGEDTTIAKDYKWNLAPGESTEIQVSFNPKGFFGPVQKYVRIVTSDPGVPEAVLTFDADVQPESDTQYWINSDRAFEQIRPQ